MLSQNDPSHTPPAEGDEALGALIDVPQGTYTTDPYESHFIRLSQDSYQSAKHWFDSSVRAQLERNLRAFRNQHPAGSKYHTEQYRKKSKIFRPKTRTAIRKQAASAAVAFFSSSDVLHCSPINDADELQRLAAELHMALIQFRLERPEMHWFVTCVGALVEAVTNGVVISKQDWALRHRRRLVREDYDDGFGGTLSQYVEESEIIEDRPRCRLLPIENFLFSAAADWRDVVNTSPFLIEQSPMYVKDVMALQNRIDPITNQPYYRPLPRGMVAAAVHQDWDSVRKAREGERIDKYDADTAIHEHQIVWVNKYIMDIDGQDYCWDTLGQELLLSNPRPLEELYLTGRRPYTVGFAEIEPHRQYPSGTPELIDGLQEETNDIANQRLDNVKLAMNKRYFAQRGAGIDVRSLIRNIAGSVTFMNNVEAVKTVDTRDVTASSYEEQDRLNLDMDDLLGEFSGGTVQANRNLNETVGGMEMMQAEGSPVRELTIRTFAETWVEPVMRQFIELESVYETDEALLLTAGHQAGVHGMDRIMEAINQPIRVKVNVGFDATNPARRVQRLAYGLGTIAQFAPQVAQNADPGEVVKEVMGALGYKDGSRFFPSLNQDQIPPREQALMQQIQMLQQYIETEQAKQQGAITVAQIREQGALARERMKAEIALIKEQAAGNREMAIAQMRDRLEQVDRMLAVEQNQIKRQELWMQREALSHEIQESDRRYQLELRGATMPEGGAPDLPGNDTAGKLTRDQYGMIPNAAQ